MVSKSSAQKELYSWSLKAAVDANNFLRPTWEIGAKNRSLEFYYYYRRCCCFWWWYLLLVYFSDDHPFQVFYKVRQVLNVHFIWTREWVRKPSTIFESRVCKRVWKMTWSEDIGTGFGQSGGTRQDLEKRAATLPPSPPTKNSEEYSPPRVCIFWKTIFVIDIVWFFSLGINWQTINK